MFSITSSYIRAIKYIIALVKFKEDKINLIDFKDEIYKGLDGKDVIVRVFYTNKKYAQSIIIFPGASPYAEEHPKMQMLGIMSSVDPRYSTTMLIKVMWISLLPI